MNIEADQFPREHDRARQALLEDEAWPGLEGHLVVCSACRELAGRLSLLDQMTPKVPSPRRGLLAEVVLATRGIPKPRAGLHEDVRLAMRCQVHVPGAGDRDNSHDPVNEADAIDPQESVAAVVADVRARSSSEGDQDVPDPSRSEYNRLLEHAAWIHSKLTDLDQAAIDRLEQLLEIDADEALACLEAQARAAARGTLTSNEALTIYEALTPHGWGPGISLEVRMTIVSLMDKLLSRRSFTGELSLALAANGGTFPDIG